MRLFIVTFLLHMHYSDYLRTAIRTHANLSDRCIYWMYILDLCVFVYTNYSETLFNNKNNH